MSEFTRADLEKAKELCEKATDGPWEWKDMPSGGINMTGNHGGGFSFNLFKYNDCLPGNADRRFIAQSRTLLPAALGALEEATRAMKRACITCEHNSFNYDSDMWKSEKCRGYMCAVALFLQSFENKGVS